MAVRMPMEGSTDKGMASLAYLRSSESTTVCSFVKTTTYVISSELILPKDFNQVVDNCQWILLLRIGCTAPLGCNLGSRVLGFSGCGIWTLASAHALRLPSIAVQGFH